MTLGQYLDKVRFFLRDFYGTAYPQAELIDCINQARQNIISDSFCTRALCTIQTVQNKVQYPFSTVLAAIQNQVYPTAAAVIGILNIAVYWSATLKPTCDYMEWGDLNAYYGSFLGFTFIPTIWGMYDLQTFYLYPIPNGVYTVEVDCVYLPNLLANANDVDVLPPTVADNQLVPYLAAAIAKNHQQAFGQAQAFEQNYMREFERRFSGFPAFRVASRYGNDPRSP
jgi:hypothetical protein